MPGDQNMSNWTVTNAYVINGDLHLTQTDGREEFLRVLRELRGTAQQLEGTDQEEREEIEAGFQAVEDAGAAPQAEADVVVGRLRRLSNRLRALGVTAGAAVELGQSVENMAHWAQQNF
jgi:hypothetical protein